MKKKCLVLVPRMPYPLNSGGRIAIYDAIKILSRKYELVIVVVDDHKENKQYLEKLHPFSNEVYFFSFSKWRFYFNSLIGLLKGKPLQVGYFYFKEVQTLVDRVSKSCDFFYAFMIRTTSYGLSLPMKKGNYAIDSMYLNYKKSEENTKSILWKLIYRVELPLLYKTELKQIKKFDLTTFVNKEEAAFWSKFGKVETLPHGVERDILQYNKFDAKYNNVVAFIGRMDYQPNIEAVFWFLEHVVNRLQDGIEFWIIGGYPTETLIKAIQRFENVKILGFVDDPYIILRSCICTVAPMQTGGGLQTKILMAMAVESIVLSTSLPINAIENAKNGVNIIVEDDGGKTAEKINDIYNNPSEYASIKGQAKILIAETYALDVIEKKLINLVEKYLE